MSFPRLVISCRFDNSHTNKYEVIAHDFDFISLMTSDVANLFMYMLAICLSSLVKSFIESYPYIKVGFFPTELNEFLIYSGY